MQVYKDTAAKDGISLESAPHGDKDFSLLGMPGSYRCQLTLPTAHFADICQRDDLHGTALHILLWPAAIFNSSMWRLVHAKRSEQAHESERNLCRRILHRPSDLQWRLLSYKDADEPLAITDLQRLEHASLASVIPITPGMLRAQGQQHAAQEV